MKEEKLPFFYIRTTIILVIMLVITLVIMNNKAILGDYYFIPVMEGVVLIIVIISGIYVYNKTKLEIQEDKLIFYNSKYRKEIALADLTKIETKSHDRIILFTNQKKDFLPHSIIDSAELFKLFFDTILQNRPDLLTDQLKVKFDLIYKKSLCFDEFIYIVDKTGFFATLMAILSFFTGMYLVSDYSAIKELGSILFLLYAIAWPFLGGLLLFLGFVVYLKRTEVDKLPADVIRKYFGNYPYSLVFSTFAEIFILFALLSYFT